MENKANTKLFGSAKAVKNEQTRHKEAGWIIHPCSAFRCVENLSLNFVCFKGRFIWFSHQQGGLVPLHALSIHAVLLQNETEAKLYLYWIALSSKLFFVEDQ
jgi:hypothetical protein